MATPLSVLQGITVSGSNSSLSGFTLATPFSYSLTFPASAGITPAAVTSTYSLMWWFGDGTYSTDYSPTHIYNWPGIYEVKVALFNNATNIPPSTFSVLVTAVSFVKDTLAWDYTNWNSIMVGQLSAGACFFGYQGCKSGTSTSGPVPLTFNYYTSILNNSALNFRLYSQGSLSQPYTEIEQTQTSDLRPVWRFTTVSANPLDEGTIITNYQPISSTPIIIDANGNYNPNGTLVGLSGSGSFYYIDDIPSVKVSSTPVSGVIVPYQSVNATTLWVTLDTTYIPNLPGPDYIDVPSYSNSLVALSSYYFVQRFLPDHVDVTLNGTIPLNSTYWPGVESQFVTMIKSPSAVGTAAFLSNVSLFNYPLNAGITNVGNTFQFSLSSTNYTSASSASFNLSTTGLTGNSLQYTITRFDLNGRDAGGYYLGTFTPYTVGAATLNVYNLTTPSYSGFAYTTDLTPSVSAGYNPTLIPCASAATLRYITNQPNSVGGYGIAGVSPVFNVVDFDSTYFARKINGNFDFSAQLKTYALQPTINQNTVLFDNYLAAVAGTSATNDDTYGGVVYERIANYVKNIADLNTANVNSFYSQAESLGLTLDNYNYDIPPTLRRVVDMYTAQQSVVWGARSQYARNFSLSAGLPNLGGILSEYNINTTIVSAGQKIVANDLFNSQNFELIEVPKITSYSSVTARGLGNLLPTKAYPVSSYPLTAYPLSAFFGWGLQTPVSQNYRFFVYNGQVDGQQVEGLVSWDDPYTTLSELSGANHADWVKDGGILESIYNYYMHQGLGLIKQ